MQLEVPLEFDGENGCFIWLWQNMIYKRRLVYHMFQLFLGYGRYNQLVFAYLVGGLEYVLFFHTVVNFIIPTDELHHFSEG